MLTVGCAKVQSSLNPHGPAAQRIANMQWLLILLFLCVSFIMWGLLTWLALRRRGTLAEHAPVDDTGGHAWITIGGIVIPFIILFVLFVLGLNLLESFPIHDPGHANVKPNILVIGHQWWWEVHYLNKQPSLQVVTANEIHIPVGQPVVVELKSDDVIHSFWVPALHGKVDLIPGHTNFVVLEASQPGAYEGQCAQYCGAQHALMRLLVVAQPPAEYQAWIAQQRMPGAEPTTPEAIAGKQVFLNGPCILCHAVRGTLAGGRVAPDLTHIGSRRLIGANSFPNNKAYLEAWITHAQSLKPECKMPNFTQFSGVQLREMVAYLDQLK
jgi:cytochrome c oxidase subunit 2